MTKSSGAGEQRLITVMNKKIRHFIYHSRLIKKHRRLIPKIISGYFKTLVLKKPVLRTVEFALLSECNSRCTMCYASKLKRADDTYLTVKEYRDIWKQASGLGAFSVILSGGEPTLRSDLFDIISVLEPQRTIFALVTNSLNMNKAFLVNLNDAGVKTIHLSLDGIDAVSNDKIRGITGHFDKVMQTIKEAKEMGMSVYLSTVIMHNGLDKMESMTDFAKKHGIGIVFSLACVSGNWAKEKDVLLTPQEWEIVDRYMKDHPFIRSDWTINFSLRQECPGGREKISISCYGDVTGCGMNFISFGNVREEPLERIWKRMHNFPYFKKRSYKCLTGADHEYIEEFIRPLSGYTVPLRIDKHPVHPIKLADMDKGKVK